MHGDMRAFVNIFRFVSLLGAALSVEFMFASLLSDASRAGLLPLIRSRFPHGLCLWRWLLYSVRRRTPSLSSIWKILRKQEEDGHRRNVMERWIAEGDGFGERSLKSRRTDGLDGATKAKKSHRDTAVSGKL